MGTKTTETSLKKTDFFSLSMLFVLSFFLFADQNLMSPNLTQIADAFGFGSIERDIKLGGEISLVFWLVGGVVTLLFGYLTDTASRKSLLVIAVLVGEIPCLLTGFVETYSQFFWLRALTGIGIGAVMPITYSLLGDYFPAGERSKVVGYLGLVVGLGMASGQMLSGFLGESYGWRAPFVLVAAPNFLVVLLYAMWGSEPNRGISDRSGVGPQISWEVIKKIFMKRTNTLVFLQGMAGTVPWSVFFVFLNDYLAQDIGFSVRVATLVVMAIGLSAMAGGFVGGIVGNMLYNKSPRHQILFSAASTFIGIVPTAFLINYNPSDPTNLSVVYPLVFGVLSGFFIAVTSPNMKAVLMNVNHPGQRGTAFSMYNLADDLGRGFGPFIVSFFILQFGRQMGFNIANCLWLLCGLFILLMVNTYNKDQESI